MTLQAIDLPPEYPELLGTLAAALLEELAELRPCDQGALPQLALQLTERCRNSIGGLRVPVASRVAAQDLPSADLTYEMVGQVWDQAMQAAAPTMPDPWRKVAVGRLLARLRAVAGGFIVPRGRALLKNRNDKMFQAFRGDFQEVAARFDVCAERARQIITARLKAEREARQGNLWPPKD